MDTPGRVTFPASYLFPVFYIFALFSYRLEFHAFLFAFLSFSLALFIWGTLKDPFIAWPIYYFCLATMYFWIGYIGWPDYSWDRYVAMGRIMAAVFQLFPFAAVPFVLLKYRKKIRPFRSFLLLLIVFIFYIAAVNHGKYSNELVVQVRNFAGVFFVFLCGATCALSGFRAQLYKRFFYIAVLIAVFGLIEYALGMHFWSDYFPSSFVSEIKEAGTLGQGVIGDKTVGVNGVIVYRLSSFFYDPAHAGQTLAFIALFFAVYLRSVYSSERPPKFVNYAIALFFLVTLVLTNTKAGLGIYVVALSLFVLVGVTGYERKLRRATVAGIVFLYCMALAVASVGMWLYFASGIVSTGGAHFAAMVAVLSHRVSSLLFGVHVPGFSILNSDSGFASIVFSVGLVGYIFFISLFLMVVRFVLVNAANGYVGVAIACLLLGWIAATYLSSAGFSPMSSFLYFFSAGVFSVARPRCPVRLG